MQPLLPVRAFLGHTWQRYTQHLGRFLEVSLWLLVPSLIQLALLFILTRANAHVELRTVWYLNMGINRVLGLVIWTWVIVRLVKLALAHDPKEEGYIATHPRIGWSLFFPALWINILFSLALFGGSLALGLPAIWLSIALSFALFFLVDQDVRGLKALDGSFFLVRKRWWAVVGRAILAGFTFLVLSFLLLMVLSLILDLAFGGSMTTQVAELTRSLLIDRVMSVSTLRAFAISDLQDSLLSSLAFPFLIIAQGILYKSLKDTYRPEEKTA